MTADFLIIGGGIAGISAAASLSSLGRVALFEAEDHPACHASGRSAALYEPHYGPPPVVALSMASGAALRAGEGILAPRGLMLVGGPDQAEVFRAERAALAMTGITVEEARAIVPVLNPAQLCHAAIADHGWDIDTDRLIAGYLRTARGNGAECRFGAPVTLIARSGAGWRVQTAQGAVEGRILVNAAGAWVDQVAAMAGVASPGFRPLRRSMARIAAPGGHDTARWPMIFCAGDRWYARPDAGALIVSPSEEDPVPPQDAWPDDLTLAGGLDRYQAFVTAPVTRPLASWAGLRTFSPDRVPVVGFAPGAPGFFWLAGQGGYGFQTAPAMADLAAALIGGRAPALDSATRQALSPARFS